MKQVTFNYKQDIETLHPDFPITAEFSVTAEVAHDESEEVRITHIEARVYTPFGGSEHWENLPIPEEKPFNRETGFLLALLRSKARDVAYLEVVKNKDQHFEEMKVRMLTESDLKRIYEQAKQS